MKAVLAFATALLGMASSTMADEEAAHSVVKITCRAAGGEWVGSGFAWNQPTQVVTALHVVAGCTGLEVYSEGLGKTTKAKAKKALIKQDLALIELDQNIGLAPVKTAGTANPDLKYTIWGYPKQVRTMQGDNLNFSKVLKSPSTLDDVLSAKEYKEALGGVGYPEYKAAVLRVGTTIQPGHSGAPIFDASGNVVGVGDGGLYQGIKSINWAIPSTVLQALSVSIDKIPANRPNQEAQFSAASGESEEAIDLPNGGELRFAFSSSVNQITATASADEQEGLKQIMKEAAEDFTAEKNEATQENHAEGDASESAAPQETGADQQVAVEEPQEAAQAQVAETSPPNLGKELLDVYEDPVTGATIAVPKGMKPSVDPATGMLKASDADGKVTLYVKVAKTGGMDALKQFEAFFNKGTKWKPDPDIADDRIQDQESLEIEKSRVAGNDPEDPDKTMTYSANVDGERFLGTAIVANDVKNLSPEDLTNVHLMEMCVELAGFRVD